MRRVFTLVLTLFSFSMVFAQAGGNFWRDVAEEEIDLAYRQSPQNVLQSYRSLALDVDGMRAYLKNTAQEFSGAAPKRIAMPMPDGEMVTFNVYKSPVMEEGLASRYPSIQTFKAIGVNNKSFSARLGLSKKGFHASIFTDKGTVYIDPFSRNQVEFYTSYYEKDAAVEGAHPGFACDTEALADDVTGHNDSSDHEDNTIENRGPNQGPVTLRIYRLAVACTGEYAVYHGGTTEDALTAIVAVVNRLNMVFERDLAIRVVLVENNDVVIYLNGATDPYTNGQTDEMIQENQTILSFNIGPDNYDLGHVLGTNNSLSGLASLQSACGSNKAQGASTHPTPVNDIFVIAIVGHEMGHQFGANHSFNSCHNVNPGTGYEPGGGTTIMSYAGICAPENNLATTASDYYHVISLEEIFNHTRNGGGDLCPEKIVTNNTEPTLSIPIEDGFYIPISTPFELTAVTEDAENDELTYCWEQFDLWLDMAPPGSPEGESPLFRSYPPDPSPTRVFPKIEKIIANSFDNAEVLPDYSRGMTFRCTVRDNNPEAGGTVWEEVTFQATETAGPFRVLHPNVDTVVWKVGEAVEVNWDVANTDNELVDCQFVDIRLSLDGGFTYPVTLAENVLNDGSVVVGVPDNVTDQARIRVEGSDNIFFDISDANFEIIPGSEPGFVLSVASENLVYCLPDIAVFEVSAESLLGFDNDISLSAIEGLPDGAEISISPSELAPNETATVSIDLTGINVNGIFEVVLQATSADTDTSYSFLAFETISTDFSDLSLVGPVDGLSQVGFATIFEWTEAVEADSYIFELATSPSFGNTVVESASDLTELTYEPENLFSQNTLFYWRVIPVNDCGPGQATEPFGFHTQTVECSPLDANDTPVNIPGNGLPTIESSLFVESSGIITDINVPIVRGNYQPVNALRVTLISPSGTEVILFNQNCGTTLNLNLGFDDDAPSAIDCPPDDGIVFQPTEPLSAFVGENTQGRMDIAGKSSGIRFWCRRNITGLETGILRQPHTNCATDDH